MDLSFVIRRVHFVEQCPVPGTYGFSYRYPCLVQVFHFSLSYSLTTLYLCLLTFSILITSFNHYYIFVTLLLNLLSVISIAPD
jgi:hypothetical protein